MLPDFERADRIGEFWGYPESRAFAELLIDARRTGAPAALVGMLRVLRLRLLHQEGGSLRIPIDCEEGHKSSSIRRAGADHGDATHTG
jgi:hypothetical protein